MPRGPAAVAIELTDSERETLVRWTRRRRSAAGLAQRSRIVLECAEGDTNMAVARRMGVSVPTVRRWRGRFSQQRLDGLVDEPRPGQPRTPAIHRWLASHPRFHLHFTPTSASWINLVERWFAELTARKLRRSTHRSVPELNKDIEDWVEHWNENPNPYVWTKTPNEILDNLTRYCNTTNASGH